MRSAYDQLELKRRNMTALRFSRFDRPLPFSVRGAQMIAGQIPFLRIILFPIHSRKLSDFETVSLVPVSGRLLPDLSPQTYRLRSDP